MKQLYRYTFLLLMVAPTVLWAQDDSSTHRPRWYVPHYVPAQFAGNIGLFSLGVGYSSKHDNYHLDLLYGYAPTSVAAAEIHTITAKNIFPVTRLALKNNRTLIPYLGLGLTVE